MTETGTYSIRPAGRHILTIGRNLIQDQYAAILELVKNAFDADSPDVLIRFRGDRKKNTFTITIADHGHGMSRDTVIGKWLVPSTDDKLKRRTSPNGRAMQGRKGIGRYAASILGDDLLLETTDHNQQQTVVYLEWKSFEDAEFLDNVEVLVETRSSELSLGTKLTIMGPLDVGLSEWTGDQLDKLKFELKKLLSPTGAILSDQSASDSFQIVLTFDGFPDPDTMTEEIIEPYPIFELFDYRIAGYVTPDGQGKLVYTNQKARNVLQEDLPFDAGVPTQCGRLDFDIRVYDREKEAIDLLIKRGLKDNEGNYLGKLQARQLLNQYNGIGVYRNDFRIRPLGDPDFDWLKLNEQRIQNPSLRIGSNQVIGYVQIEPEEISGLEEKSARDGLRDNISFQRLKAISREVISLLEQRRFSYRQKAGLSRHAVRIEKELERLFVFDDLKRGIKAKLKKGGVDDKTTAEVIRILAEKEEDSNRIVEDIRHTVAIYQGQATLGKIINVILHEGRKPLNYFKNIIPDINYWADKLLSTNDHALLPKIIPLINKLGTNADVFATLFARLDPLAAGKRPKKKSFLLADALESSFHIFENELHMHGIKYNVSCDATLRFSGWPQDIYVILTNLIDNSIYWLTPKNIQHREISLTVTSENNSLTFIDYRDTGPGIEPSLIESEVIFEPEFSTKPGGTGLGLAIAGEAAARNALELKAYTSDSGAYFRLEPKEKD